jgi:hypothetical protein
MSVFLTVFVSLAASHAPVPSYHPIDEAVFVDTLRTYAKQTHRKLTQEEAVSLTRQFDHAGAMADVDPLFFAGLTYAESRWRNRAIGDGGNSRGIWQMSVSCVRAVMGRVTKREALEVIANKHARTWVAGAFWRRLLRKWSRREAATVYNCGPIRCKQSNGTQRKTTPAVRGYFKHFRRMLAIMGEFSS